MIDDGGIVALARPTGQCGFVTQYMLCLGSDLGDPHFRERLPCSRVL